MKTIEVKKKKIVVELNAQKIYPPLEDLEVTPSGVEQNFKSSMYGYDNVKVKAVASDTLKVTPSKEEQQHIGLYGTVNVEAVDSSIDENIKAENIKEGINILGVIGEAASTDKIEKVIDDSGVIDVEGSIEDKIDGLIDYAKSENLWFKVSKNINLTNQNSPFLGNKWQEKTIPRIDFAENITTNYVYSFSGNGLEYIDYYMNTKKGTSFGSCFSRTNSLKWIQGINTSNATSVSDMFNGSSIESITEPFDFSNVTNANKVFNGCKNLKNIRFVAETIKISLLISECMSLSIESIQSIINGLATVSTTQTLTLHANVKANLTDEQIASITSKNWTLA